MPVQSPELIPTANGYGWTSTIPNQITCRWLDYLRLLESPRTLDIGAGLGVATLPALQAGAWVIANDIDESHLCHVARRANEMQADDRLELLAGEFPRLRAMIDLDAIHCSNVLHFLSGDDLLEGTRWMAHALKPSGKLFLQTMSPHAGHFRSFSPEYARRRVAGFRWPGEMRNAKDYVDPSLNNMIPSLVHVLEIDIAKPLFESVGLIVEYCDYYSRPGLPEVCRLDGRENLGIVATRCM